MSTSFWSFIAAGVLLLFSLAGFGIGYFLNRASPKDKSSGDDSST